MESATPANDDAVPRKRRRAGWDAPAQFPASTNTGEVTTGPTIINPVLPMTAGLSAPNPLIAHQQTQQILLAQQVLAQSMAAAVVKPILPLGLQGSGPTITSAAAPVIPMPVPTPYIPRPECRIYVGLVMFKISFFFHGFKNLILNAT
jgi:hypothetical protein